uniref:Chromo domain-containing protein n=1 Tax=Triticum aestivum TaxID=4565 RepID=A0A3B6QB37_WHEAT
MGNSRPGGAPPTSSGSVAGSNPEAVPEAPRLRPHGGPGASGLGSPGRSTPLPGGRERGSTAANVMTPSCDRQQNRAVEEAPLGGSSAVKKSSVPNSLSRGSDGSSGSRMGAEEQVMSEHASNGDAGSSSKKRRKRMDARSYIKKFKTGIRPGASAAVVASPDRMGKENTSSGHVADNNNNAAILCEGSRLIEKSKGHSSHAAFKVSKSPISGLHETSDTRVDQCSTPLLEVQPHKPTDVQNIAAESSLPAKARDPHTGPARQNILSSLQSVPISTIHQEEVLPHKRTVVQDIAAESSLPAKDRDRHTGPARQNIVPSLQSVPISSIHHKEIKSTLGDAEPISVQKENSAPGHLQVARSDGTDGNPNICVACGLGSPGTFRSCDGKGCKSRYHMSCLDQYLSLGNWFCTSCTKKRLQSGLHHIVDGIESVWDVKEAEGMQTSKQYFVKYKNLAHVHNRWVPEGDISVMPGGPDLLSLFNKRNHTEKTIRKEWTKPHRLLRKRLLVPPRLAEDFFCSDDFLCSSGVSYCTLEWLVKWRGLGYDHATWELETLSCLCTPEADELKENYENHREAAKQSSIPQKTKVKQSSFQKLERLPDGCHPDFDNDHLYSINHLREYWHKSRGAVLVDDKEYVIKTVLFTMSVLPDVSQPFLILTTPGSLSLWEVQFNKLAPFINVVVYDGGKDELKLIRDLEFYESGSHCMLQVLLSHPDAILEDIEPIAHIGWEAVIVDYYQKSALQYLEQLKQFPTDFRMLLVSSPIKDNLPEYVKLQAFLNSGEQENGSYVDTAETLMMLKGNFKSHIAYERQADSSKILEHWVPAYVSQLQLQTYCSILLSNSSVLQSQMKSDKALYDIIMSLSKCCDDPYLVDESLRPPVNNHDQTDPTVTRVQACGKLLLLQKMLEAIRNKRLRVIILFQSGAPAGSSMGDTLETVVRHKFGPESYERVGFCGSFSKKAVALNKFNDKTKGRFVFLIETNACLPSIELSSVDAIIIYNSDWNPLTDQKALQRIKIESHLSYPSIFRLYTPLTMEEKWLVLAKQGMLIDKKDITHSVSHSFISWGASCLFTRLDELKHDNCASKNSERDNFMDKVVSEFLKKLATNVVGSTKLNCTCISEANMSGKFYSRNITLVGEKEEMCALDGDPSKFWLNLLDGKSPSWSYISEPPQSSHNILQNMEEPPKVPAEEEPNETRRKRRKVGEITGPSSKSSHDNNHHDVLPENSTSSPAIQPLDDAQQTLGVEKRMSTPKNLHVQLKKELSKLITALQLPDDVRAMAEQLFEYFLKNHLVVTEPVSILHAIIISLCWHAASVLKYNINCGESIALAGKSLNCECNEELASFIYGRLRFPEEKNPNRAIETSINGQPVSVEDTQISWEETSTNLATNLRINHMLQNKEMDHGNLTSSGPQEVSSSAEHMIPEVQEPVQETHGECHVSNDELPNMIVEKRTELDNNLDNFTNGAPQVISSGAEQMISEVQEPIQEIHRESHLPNDELPNMTLEKRAELVDNNHDNFTNGAPQVVSSGADHMISEEQEPVQETHRECHLSKDDLPNMIVEKRMELIDNVFSLREKNILCKQQLEISGLDTYTQNNVIRLKEVCTLVLKHIRRSHIDEVTRSDKIKLTVQWFTMLMYAFLDHMSLQHNKLEALQSDRWLVERHLKENLHQVAKSGQLDQDFDRHIALPDSNFVMEEFIHFKEQSGEYHIVESSVSDNQQSLDDGLLMEIALVRNEVLSGAISTQAMENEPAATSVDSSEGPASEAVDFPGNCILSSDGMGVQRAGCSSSTIPANDDSVGQESSSGDSRNTGHVEAENIANPSMLLEGADSLVRGLNANNDTVDTDQVHLESPVSPATLPMSTEFETQTCQSSMHVEQSPEVQQSTSMQDQPAEKRACIVGPEAAMQDQPAEAEQAGTLGAISAQVLPPEMQSSSTSMRGVPFVSGLQSPSAHQSVVPSLDPHAGVELSGTVTPHAIQPPASMPVEQSTSLPAQQSLATLRHPPAEAEPAGILATEAACDLQPEARLSTSMQDQAAEEGACIMGATAARGSQPEVQPSTSLDSHAGAESTDTLGVVTAPDMQSEIQPSALMQDRPVAAEGACVLGTTVAQELQPELQTATTVQHDPLERTRSEERRQAGFEPNTAASPEHDLQSEIQPSASMRDRPAGAEGAGMVGSTAAQDLQPERQLSTTVQHIPIGPEQPTQLPPVTPLVFNNPIFSDEPLRNELEKIIHWSTLLDKGHDDKRSQLQAERNQEIEKINRKYDSLLQQEDSAHRLKRTQLNGIYQKVYVSKSLAENFRCQFTPSVASHGRSTGHVMDQLPESSSAARGHVMDQLPESSSSSAARGPASPPVIPSSAIRAPVHSSAGSYVRPSLVASRTVQSQSAMPGNLSGATSPPFVPAPSLHASHGPAGPQLRPVQPQSVPPSILYRTMPPGIPTPRPQGSYRPAGAAAAQQLRAPSPHLQHLRMRPPYVTPTDQQQQQQLPAILGVPAGGQFVTDSLRPAFPQPGAVLASMTPAAGSAHQPVPPSAPGSSSATPTYFVPPGRHTDPVWTPNPALTVAQLQQQASYLNMALGGGSSTSAGPAAPGSQQHAGGAQLPAVLNHPGLEPSPPPNSNRYMPARFGVEPDSSSGGTSNAAGPSAEVVCLSDDEA